MRQRPRFDNGRGTKYSSDGTGTIMSNEESQEGADKDGEPRDSSDSGADRRRHPRVKAKLHMVYEDGVTQLKTRVIDISMGGVFLEMENLPKAGTEIRLTPILPNRSGDGEGQGEGEPRQIRGRVVRVVEYDLENFPKSSGGVGIEFSDVSESERSVLSSIFRQGIKDLQEDDVEGEEPEQDDDCAQTGEWAQIDPSKLPK